jgi:integrase
MAKFNFNLRNASANSETPINLVIRYNNQKLVYPTKLTIHPKNWNVDTQTARKTKHFFNADNFNTDLENIINNAKYVFLNFKVEHQREPSIIELREILNDNNESMQVNETLLSFVDKVIEQTKIRTNDRTKKPISKNTIKVFNQCKRLLTEFHKTIRKIDFVNIDLDFYHDFKEFMIKKEYAPNTISKHIGTLKTILNEATDRGINSNLAFKSKRFSAPKVEVDSIFFNDTELDEIYNINLSEFPRLDRARDLFLVGCYTGLRFGDWSIKPESIKGNYIEVLTEKTNEIVLVAIHPKVKAIMTKYEGLYSNSLPPSIANQNMNLYLKEVCGMIDCLKVDINKTTKKGNLTINETIEKHKLVTTHTARRSFATNLYLQGFPTINIMKLTGHRTEKSFLKYIKITPTDNAKSLELHWNKLNSLKLKIG